MSRRSTPPPHAASRLTQRVTLLRPVHTQDSVGDTQTTWVQEDTVWAEVQPDHAPEALRDGVIRSRQRLTIRLRPHATLAQDWQIRFHSEDYRVLSMAEEGARTPLIKLKVEKKC